MSETDIIETLGNLDLEEREKELIRINEELDQKRKEISQRADTLLKHQETILNSKIDDTIDLTTVKDLDCIRSHFESSQSESISSDNDDTSGQETTKTKETTQHTAQSDQLSSNMANNAHNCTISTVSVAADASDELVKHSKKLAIKYDLECNPRSQIPSALNKQTTNHKKKSSNKKKHFEFSSEMKEADLNSSETQSISNSNNLDTFEIDNEFLNDGYSSKQVSQRGHKSSVHVSGSGQNGRNSNDKSHKLSSVSALRLQKARFKLLEKNFNELIDIKNEKDKELNECNKQLKLIGIEKNKLDKKCCNLQIKYQNQCETNSNLLKKIERLECENSQIKRELKQKNLEKINKQDTIQKNDIRLNRALEEAEKYRNLLIKYKNENMSNISTKDNEITLIKQENKKLEKQKIELLSAFRKQMKLIDILKKQKIHLEAAKVLEFTEDQFVKTLDIGQKLMHQ